MNRKSFKTAAATALTTAAVLVGAGPSSALSFAPLDPNIYAQIDAASLDQVQRQPLSVADFGGFDHWALIDCPLCFTDVAGAETKDAVTAELETWGAIDLGAFPG